VIDLRDRNAVISRLHAMVHAISELPDFLWNEDIFPENHVTIVHKETGATLTLIVGIRPGKDDEVSHGDDDSGKDESTSC